MEKPFMHGFLLNDDSSYPHHAIEGPHQGITQPSHVGLFTPKTVDTPPSPLRLTLGVESSYTSDRVNVILSWGRLCCDNPN